MAAFFARTWFIWWTVAVVVIVRWFQVAGASETETIPSPSDGAAGSTESEMDSFYLSA
jgi:hypothetical protein